MPAGWSNGRGFADRCTSGLNARIHEQRIVRLDPMIRPRGDHKARILWHLEQSWRMGFVVPTYEEKQRQGVLAQVRKPAHGNEDPWIQTFDAHGLGSCGNTH